MKRYGRKQWMDLTLTLLDMSKITRQVPDFLIAAGLAKEFGLLNGWRQRQYCNASMNWRRRRIEAVHPCWAAPVQWGCLVSLTCARKCQFLWLLFFMLLANLCFVQLNGLWFCFVCIITHVKLSIITDFCWLNPFSSFSWSHSCVFIYI